MRDGTPAVVPVVHGAFYVATGLWPLVHYRSFEKVTGPRADRWLVKTFGAVIAAVGVSLLLGGFRRARRRALKPVGTGVSLATGLANLLYAGRGRISPVYLTDAVAEAALFGAWLLKKRQQARR